MRDCSKPVQQQLLLGFAARVRRGYFGRETQVQSQTPETALRHVAQTLVLAGYPDPRRSYGSKDLDLPFSRLLRSYKTDDPAPKPHLALPVRPIQCAVPPYNNKGKLFDFAISDLLTISFFLFAAPRRVYHADIKIPHPHRPVPTQGRAVFQTRQRPSSQHSTGRASHGRCGASLS